MMAIIFDATYWNNLIFYQHSDRSSSERPEHMCEYNQIVLL